MSAAQFCMCSQSTTKFIQTDLVSAQMDPESTQVNLCCFGQAYVITPVIAHVNLLRWTYSFPKKMKCLSNVVPLVPIVQMR